MSKKFKIYASSSQFKKIEFDLQQHFHVGDIVIHHEKKQISFHDHYDLTKENEEIMREVIHKVNEDIEIEEITDEKMYRKILIFENLDCANCAAKIERIAKRTLKLQLANVDFATGRMIVETKDQNTYQQLDSEISKIAKSVDANIEIKHFLREKSSIEQTISIWKKTAFILGIIIFLIGVATKYSLLVFLDHELHNAIIIVTYLFGYTLLGGDIIYGAFKNIKSGRVFDEKFLMVLATLTALGVGFYEEAVSVMIFYKIGEFLQESAVNKSRKSIASLIDLQVHTIGVEKNGEIVDMVPEDIYYDDVMIIKTGERVPLDGVIVSGATSLDISALTGESMLKTVNVNDAILSGAINAGPTVKVAATKLYSESTMTKIVNMIENASSLKSKSENFISKFARYYTPTVVVLALMMVFLIPLIRGSFAWSDFQDSIYTALIFLVVSCPCALVISIPLGFFGGIGAASKQGVLVKGSNYLEALNNVKVVAFDKTGTLTKGNFAISEIVPYNGFSKQEVLKFAAYAESLSNHPIAKSVVQSFGKDNIDTKNLVASTDVNQFGVIAFYNDEEIIVGKKTFLESNQVHVPEVEESEWMIHVAYSKKYVGRIIMEDQIKEEASTAIQLLQGRGIQTIMLTGDTDDVAHKVSENIGIGTVYANMLPADKVGKIEELQKNMKQNEKLLFIGDGINDAPALGLADIGVAMGALGSDAAIEVADVVLMSDDLNKIPKVIEIANMTRRIVIQNIVLALGVKLIVLAMAPFGLAYIWEAIFADVGVSLIAILNALRIVKKYR